MRKMPFRLDGAQDIVYVLRTDDGEYGPYSSESSARKAAGRARITATILRVRLTTETEVVAQYNGEKEEWNL